MEKEKFVIEKSKPLRGTVKISGSKNAVLPVMAASLLTAEECLIQDVPALSDVFIMSKILESLGAKVYWNKSTSGVKIRAGRISATETDYELVSRMRASFLVMGPLLARTGKVKIPLPGGCAIGARPIDLHLKGFTAMGAKIVQEHGFVSASAKRLRAARIYLDFPSVGATENILMAACLAKGRTVLENCATEPEVVDLANFLNSIGAKVRGAGTDTIKVDGVKSLNGGTHNIIPDRIEAGTFMVAAAITGGDVELVNVVSDHLKPVIAKLREAGFIIGETERGLRVHALKTRPRAIDLKTLPYPGFPTDMQAQFMSLLALCEGTSVVTETVFENRFMHIGELKRMGADIKIEGRSAIVEGAEILQGTQVRATDLRAGAA
ncbi:MAG: UDP-N-acetylglucosamine 1-carboxyvinyltransferase, partial [Defluviitaleaceae bacterium]|nr:UDP-N-acetylglucosamine 1-carboxyvinyltransferase [Defluviitaleaceae bacterium]